MGETGHHNHNHDHHHPPPPSQVAPPPIHMPLGAAKGPTYPPAEQLLQLNYCIHSNPSWPQSVLLAFQHYIVMLGGTVMISTMLVTRMGGSHAEIAKVIQASLFMSGINTLLQTLFGTRLPTVMTPSFAYLISAISVINDLSHSSFTTEHERFTHTIRAIHGSLIVSSFINIILGYGRVWTRLAKLFSPIVIAPVVCLVGLGLFARGFPQLANCVEIGLPLLLLLIIVQQYVQRIFHAAHSHVERFALLVCIAIIWAFAAILTVSGAYNNTRHQTQISCRTDKSLLMSSAPWIKVPYPFQWGTPIFRASHVFGMFGAALVSSVESAGTIYASSRLAGATLPPAHVLSRSIGLQGIGQLLEGIFGAAVGSSVSVENVGLLGLTRVGSRRVVQISTGFMIFFSIFGKFGAFFASIPLPLYGAIYCVLFGIVACTGVSFFQFANSNSIRNIYVFGLSLFLGLSISQYFVMNTDPSGHGPVQTGGGWFNDILNTFFSSSPTVALIVGTIIDNTLNARHNDGDRGLPWFLPFLHRHGDSRNEEFYNFPHRIHQYVPRRFM